MDALPSSGADLALDSLRMRSVTAPRAPKSEKEATEVAKNFEGMVVGQMLSYMWEGIKTDGYFGGGSGEEAFRSLMIQEYGKQISAAGGLGIADSVKRQLLAMQEQSQATGGIQ